MTLSGIVIPLSVLDHLVSSVSSGLRIDTGGVSVNCSASLNDSPRGCSPRNYHVLYITK